MSKDSVQRAAANKVLTTAMRRSHSLSNTSVSAGVPSPSSQNMQALERAADDIASMAMTLGRLSTQLNTMNRTVFMAGDSPGKKYLIAAARALETAITQLHNASTDVDGFNEED